MRKVVLFIASSLDGYIAREDGGIDWLFTDGDYGYSEFYDSIDTILVGRRTYDQSLEFDEYPYKGGKKVYVFTREKRASDQNAEFISSDVAGFVSRLVQSPGKDIWLVGGADIASILLNADLVDEIILSIHPVVLGTGIPLFKDVQKDLKLKLRKTVPFESGLVQLHYEL
jgi:dihydrofolate reductase